MFDSLRPFFRVLVALMFLGFAAKLAVAQNYPFQPDRGASGYQQIELGPDAWYLTYLGAYEDETWWIQAAWNLRAAQLCTTRKADHFVELRYTGEPVLSTDKPLALESGPEAWPTKAVYIFVPVPRRRILANPFASKLAAVRCIPDVQLLKDPKRAVSVKDSIATAIKLDVIR